MHCGDQRHLGLCLSYVPALACGSCRVSDQGTTLRASDLHNARATILNPFNIHHWQSPAKYESCVQVWYSAALNMIQWNKSHMTLVSAVWWDFFWGRFLCTVAVHDRDHKILSTIQAQLIHYLNCISLSALCVCVCELCFQWLSAILYSVLVHDKRHGLVSPIALVFIPLWAHVQIYVYIVGIFRLFGSLIEYLHPGIMVSSPTHYYLYRHRPLGTLLPTYSIYD